MKIMTINKNILLLKTDVANNAFATFLLLWDELDVVLDLELVNVEDDVFLVV